ncbi:hypothetical protein [Roseibium algae]|uniref:Terminase small subunit n=1 Tax=Roseibium algae TaxID=3123038 RepID=A0ABU8TIF7_9HYPH
MGRDRVSYTAIREVRAGRESVKRGGSLAANLPERFTDLPGAKAEPEIIAKPRKQVGASGPKTAASPKDIPGSPIEVQAPEEIAALLRETAASQRPDMIARLYSAFEAQVDQVEARLQELLKGVGAGADGEAGSGASIVEIDRTVKTLASLARTLSLLLDLKKTAGEAEAAKEVARESERDADDSLPDADALRAQLAQRLGRLRQREPAG